MSPYARSAPYPGMSMQKKGAIYLHPVTTAEDPTPKIKTGPIYKFEEDLLNEALKQGFGRGDVRAEWRQEKKSQDSQMDESCQKTKVNPREKMENRPNPDT